MNAALNWSWIYEQVTQPTEATTPRDKPKASGKKGKGRGKNSSNTKGTTR